MDPNSFGFRLMVMGLLVTVAIIGVLIDKPWSKGLSFVAMMSAFGFVLSLRE